jgi:hypothetical protein
VDYLAMAKADDLDLKKRLAKGRTIRAQWLAAISAACNVDQHEVRFLGLEETDRLKDAYFRRVREAPAREHLYWTDPMLVAFEAGLARLVQTVGTLPTVMFSSVDEYLGAVMLPAKAILEHWNRAWTVVDHDLCITTDSAAHGLCLEKNHIDEQGMCHPQSFFEATSWGNFQLMIDGVRSGWVAARPDTDGGPADPSP